MLGRLVRASLLACCAATACFARVSPPSGASVSPAQADPFFQEKWMATEGLPSSSIVGIARTRDGALWVGTPHAISRFDGARFEQLRYALPGRGLDFVTAGPDSQIYLGMWDGGLVVIRDRRMRVFGKSEGLQDTRISIVLPVGDDEAWLGTFGGFLYHYVRGSIREASHRLAVKDAIFGLTRARDGTIWIGAESGLYFLQGDRFERYHPKTPLPVPGIFDLATADDGSIFAASDHGLFQINGDAWRLWTTKDGLPSDRIQVLAFGSRNRLWIGTVSGLALLNDGRVNGFKDSGCEVFSLVPDEDGAWFGCHNAGGLRRLRHRAVAELSLPGSVRDMRITSLVEDRAGAVWMASPNGLIRWRDGRATVYTRKDGLATNNIQGVALAPDGGIWIITENGFAKMKSGHLKTFRTLPLGSEDLIYSVLEDRHGAVWVGGQFRLLRRRRDDPDFEEIPEVNVTVDSLREDRAGNVWAATKGSGLFRFSKDRTIRYDQSCGLASNAVVDLVEVEDGGIWVATDKGLSRIKDGKCASLRADNGFASEEIVSIGYDGQGRLWLNTGGGLLALEVAQANHVIDAGEGTLRSRFLSRPDDFGEELPGVWQMNSIIRHSSGEMWFAMSHGVGRVSPEALRTAPPEIRPELTRVTSNQGEHDLAKPLVLKPGDLRLQFSYGASALLGAKSIEYRYRLVNFDQSWQMPGDSRNATYTSLPPGNYRFQVSARRPFQPWTELSHPLELSVLLPFYRTWWWFTLLAFAFLSLTYSLYRLRLLAVRKQNAALMTERLRERSALARELHDTLAQGMLGIHIQIEAAQQLLENNPRGVRKHLENVGRIAREASVDTRRSIAALRSEDACDWSLPALLEGAAAKFEHDCDIDLGKNLADDLPNFSPEISHEILRIVEEALANVRSHSGARTSSLSARTTGNALLIEIADNGSGFEMEPAASGHFGILGMRERALNINAKLRVSSAGGKGTSVMLEVPFHPSLNRQILLRGRWLMAFGKRWLTQNGAERRE